MNCVCGYEDKNQELKFIHIELSNEIKPQIYKGLGEYEGITLHACPICKTVKMKTWLE